MLVPSRAKDAADGLPAIEIKDPPVGKRGPLRIAMMALQTRRTKGVDDQLSTLDIVHYPLTVPYPPGERAHGRDAARRPAPRPPGVLRPGASVVPSTRLRPRGPLGRSRHRDERVRPRSSPGRARPRSEHGSTWCRCDRPLRVSHRRRRARGDRPLSGTRLAAQEPCATVQGVRDASRDPPAAPTRPDRRRFERLEPLPEGVESLGEVPPSQLASLYRRAACLVYPSLYEGFGIPPLEAMACGCPVAASNAGALPEICGDAAVLFDPTDVDAMAAAIVEADERHEELRDARPRSRRALHVGRDGSASRGRVPGCGRYRSARR